MDFRYWIRPHYKTYAFDVPEHVMLAASGFCRLLWKIQEGKMVSNIGIVPYVHVVSRGPPQHPHVVCIIHEEANDAADALHFESEIHNAEFQEAQRLEKLHGVTFDSYSSWATSVWCQRKDH